MLMIKELIKIMEKGDLVGLNLDLFILQVVKAICYLNILHLMQ